MINAGIVGGSGYTAGELIRLLLHHPETEIDFIFSTSRAGKPVTSVHQDLLGDTNLTFSSEINPEVDVLFLCTGHGNSTEVLQAYTLSGRTKIIDLSRDFRLSDSNILNARKFVYGLPELQKDMIASAENIANPGCFATAIQLALLPLAYASKLENDIHIHGITGATGAGSSLSETTHFSWRSNNVSIYKALSHQHIGEVEQSLKQLSPSFKSKLNFIPVRGNFSRGIFISAYTQSGLSLEKAQSLFEKFYADTPFVQLSDQSLHLKQVANTNKCLLYLHKKDGKLLITSIIDNLLKGASGQALQNMNLMFGLDESDGLQLKATYF
ncbi:N-acetyl-gamma-glutamyl-phosphate reductase [Aliifodinibius salipaludis]|uniref:N-acetyl-gamma-glutamyl-phosphate reductase n=1 Tax=Fodinibius salipaludis TaxID=2032627 RepID=A0A2A2G8F7_9BACT|nr:N-acetyl-gamma-glutamyl-phosphate reductase [Aliifodinibius salipaludis]PAU93598.1 N-acetyl-gamma-glutamyl-phosphate reductase [Aliifodinibius salipaludis]